MSAHTARRRLATGLVAVALSPALLAFVSLTGAQAQGDPPAPNVSVSAPASPLIGESVGIDLSFVNGSASEAGYGPYIDLQLPLGADGDDGITFTGATYLGAPVTATQLIADGSGCVTHPYAVNSSGVLLHTCGLAAGQSLVVLRLPFGSFTAGQPAATVHVTGQLSALADAGTGLAVVANGGFQFGADALANPASDPSIVGTVHSGTVTPTVIRVSKTYLGPEDETATGPNYRRGYTITATVAPGQTVDSLVLSDLLPSTIQYVSTDSPTVPASAPVSTPSTGTPGGTLSLNFGTVHGTGGTDAAATFRFYVPRLDATSSSILPAGTGAFNTSTDSLSASATWTPVDTRDAPGPVAAGPVTHTLTDKSVAIQKSVRLAVDTDASGASPGDILEWTLSAQVSDYFALGNVVIYDKLGDGTRLEGSFAPTLQVAGNGFSSVVAPIDAANYTVGAVDSEGVTPIAFRLSGELVARGRNGRMVGGCINPNTGTANPNCAPGYDDGPTTATIVFRSIIQRTYVSNPTVDGPRQVVEGDTLGNQASVTGDVLNTSSFAATGSSIGDGSVAVASAGTSASISIQRGSLAKSIYAVNGDTHVTLPLHVSAGDAVTYRLEQTFPNSRTDDFRITDFLPLPVFYAAGITEFDATAGAAAPPPGTAKYGPADTFHSVGGPAPTVSSDVTANSVQFLYGDFALYPAAASTADILFTVSVSNDPFADGLLLTNQARSQTRNAVGALQTADAIVQITLDQPVLAMTKGVVATDAPHATFTPATVGPVVFSVPPGAGCAAWTGGNITSADLSANPIDSNLSGVDAGDYVRFAIAVQNTGHARAFEVAIRDVLPTGFAVPAGGLDMCVANGAGQSIATTKIGGGGGLFDQGIRLDDGTDGNSGSLAPETAGGVENATGTNVAVVTFTLQVAVAAVPGSTITNTGSLLDYTNANGSAGHLASPLNDDATVQLTAPTASKSMPTTDQGSTLGTAVAIGEVATYRVTLTLPEGTLPAAKVTDVLSPGLALVGCDLIVPSSGVTTSLGGGFDAACDAGTDPSVNGQNIVFSLGTITNANTDNSTPETLTLTYRAVVLNVAGNQRGTALHNTATLSWTGGSAAPAGTPDITVDEPSLTVSKVASPTTGDAGDTIQYDVTVTNSAVGNGAVAFDVAWSDTVPAGLTYVPNSLQLISGPATTTLSDAGRPTLSVTWATTFVEGAVAHLRFSATVNGSAVAGSVYHNTASTTWTSLPGDVRSALSPFDGASTERTGSAGDPGGVVNTYTASSSADVTVPLATVSKSVTDTNQSYTSGYAVAVGEIVTYQVVAILPEGVMPSARLTDTLPAGLAMVDCVSIGRSSTDLTTDLAGGFAAACHATGTPPLDPTVGVGGQVVTFDLGEISNANRVNGTAETLTISYRAVVLNAASNVRGQPLHNSAVLSWTGGIAATASALDVHVVEPAMTVSKTRDHATGDAGDIITFTITIANPTNINGTDAFDTAWSDSIPTPGLTYVLGSLKWKSGNVPDAISAASAPALSAAWTNFGQNTASVLEYKAVLDANVPSGAVYTNTAHLTWTSLPGDVRTAQSSFAAASTERTGSAADPGGVANNYVTTSSTTVTVTQPAPVKTLVGTSETDTTLSHMAVGEIARFRVVVTIPEGVTPVVSISDAIPAGLRYLNDGTTTVAFVSTLGTGLTSDTLSGAGLGVAGNAGCQPTFQLPAGAITGGPFVDGTDPAFALGTLTNADSDPDAEVAVIEFNALVDNVAANVTAHPLSDAATIKKNGTTLATSAGLSVTVAEPSLTYTKVISTAPIDGGDTIVYQITVTNAAGANVSPAYEFRAQDALDSGLIPVSVVVGGPAGWVDHSNVGAGAVDVTFTAIMPGAAGNTITVTAKVADAIDAHKQIPNTATASWTSLPGTNGTVGGSNTTGSATPGAPGTSTGERINDGGALNNYRATSPAPVTLAAPSIHKYGPTPASATIGATAGFDLLVILPEGTSQNLSVIDTLPAGLAPVSATVITDHNLSGGRLSADFSGALAVPTMTPPSGFVGGPWTLAFGSTVVPADGLATNDSFVVHVVVRVGNVLANQAGVNLTNRAGVRYSDPSSGLTTIDALETPALAIVEPVLKVTKTVDSAAPRFGEVVTYTLVLQHDVTSTADAYDVALGDTLPAGLTYLANSLTNTAGRAPTSSSAAGGVITIAFGSFPAGSSSTFTYEASVRGSSSVSLKQSLVNAATATWTSLAGTDANERTGADGVHGALNDYAAASNATVTVSGVDLSITDTDFQVSATAGVVRTYALGYQNDGNQTANGSTITETVPVGTTFNSAASSGGWNCLNGATAGTICRHPAGTGDVAAGGSGSVNFAVTVVDPIPSALTQISDTATIADDGSKNVDPTPANNTATDVDSIPVADLSLAKTVDVPRPAKNQIVTFTLTLHNSGPVAATTVKVVDVIPAALTYVGSTPSQGTYDSGSGLWTVNTVNNGASATLTIQARVTTAVGATNSAEVTHSDQNDPDSTPGNGVPAEDDYATANIRPLVADLAVIKTANVEHPDVGSDVTFTIVATNLGPDDAATAQVADTLPAGLTYKSSSATKGSYVVGTHTWTIGSLDEGASETLTLVANVANTGTITNTATISGSPFDPDPSNNSASTATSQLVDIAVTKIVDNPSPNVGTIATFTVTVGNSGPGTAHEVVVHDMAPAGLTVIATTPSQGSYSSVTGDWTIGTIAPSGSVTMNIQASVVDHAPMTNTASLAAVDEPQVSTANDSASVTITPPSADLEVAKTVDQVRPDVGDADSFTITLTNKGPDTATGVAVSDLLPAGLTFASADAGQGSYVASSGIWTVGTLASNASATLTIHVIVALSGDYTNTAAVSASDQYDPVAGNNADSVALSTRISDIEVTKSASDPAPAVGSNVSFTIVATNKGPDSASQLIVHEALPSGLTFVSAVPSGGTYDPASGDWTVGGLVNGAEVTLSVTARVVGSGSIANTATVTGLLQRDPDPANDSSTATIHVPPAADLGLTKTVDEHQPAKGATVTFVLTVTNSGPDATRDVVVHDALPAGLTFVSSSPSHGTYDPTSGDWTVNDLAIGASESLQVTATVDVEGSIVNTAEVTSSALPDPDSTPGNGAAAEDDQASVTINGHGMADLSLTKAADATSATVGSEVTYTLVLTNNGPDNATGVVVRDQLPVGLTYDSHQGGAYDPTTGGWSVGSLGAGQSATLTITVRVGHPGTMTNVAEVAAADQRDPNSTPDDGVPSENDEGQAVLGVASPAPSASVRAMPASTPPATASRGTGILPAPEGQLVLLLAALAFVSSFGASRALLRRRRERLRR
jgi:uncharacterized repeat protein (TIGR01451 family)/fimbrial isopeptide formation D2 family protein